MREKTYTLTVFLMKDYVKYFENCIKKEAQVEFIELKKDLDLDGKVVVSDCSVNKPKWTEIIEYFSDKDIEIDCNVSNKALLLLRINGRIFALTFGYGRSFLIDENIEKDFGLKTALNLIDTNKIKSINSATIEDLVVYTQKQSGFATEQSSFDINTINDIMTSVTGTTKNDSLAIRISGKDSLLVTIKMSISELKEKLCCYLDAYKSNYYKKNGFDWIDNIREVRDKNLKENLENELIRLIKKKELNNIYISPSENIDWMDSIGFVLTGMNKKKDDSVSYEYEIDIEKYISCFKENCDYLSKLKRDKLKRIDLNENEQELGSVYNSIIANIRFENNAFVLNDGIWYKIDSSFYDSVIGFVSKIPKSSLNLPVCKDTKEGDYNSNLSKEKGFALVDKKLTSVEGGHKSIEPCDLFTKNKQFIHVKNRHASAQLSHLFAQGRVSAQCFIEDEKFRHQLYEIVKKKLGNDIFDYKIKPNPQEYEVVYAIISKYNKPVEEDLPFFSLVNLMLAVKELNRMNIKSSVVMIKKE